MITVTADINANLKILKSLERQGLIEITQIDIENPSPKTKKAMPTGVFDYSEWDCCVCGSEESSQVFEKIKKIIGSQNFKDAMHLSDHIRDKRNFFITEDNDFLSKRESLESIFIGLKILTPAELNIKLVV